MEVGWTETKYFQFKIARKNVKTDFCYFLPAAQKKNTFSGCVNKLVPCKWKHYDQRFLADLQKMNWRSC